MYTECIWMHQILICQISGYSEKQDRILDIRLLRKTGSDSGYPATQKNRIGYPQLDSADIFIH